MKKKFKATLAVAAIVAVCMGSVKTYQSYSVSNQMGEDNMLLAENVMSYSDAAGIPWGKICKWTIAGIYVCIDYFGDSDDNEYHYTKGTEKCIYGYDSNNQPINGIREVCVKQNGKGNNDCNPGYRGPCEKA